MLVEQIWTNNAWRNFNYLIACPETGDALAIDPLNFQQCEDVAASRGWKISQILNTHEHHDHIEGNNPLKALTQAKLLAHKDAPIENVDVRLTGGEIVKVGSTVELLVIDTPGHTMSHICLYFSGNSREKPALFCGDTLFNAGVGRCDFGGEPKILHKTFEDQIFPLPNNVRIFPGHNYIENNIEFTLDREPDNQQAASLRDQFQNGLDAESFVSDIGLEREINVFFRADQLKVREGIASSLNIDIASLNNQKTFIGLRKLRDTW